MKLPLGLLAASVAAIIAAWWWLGRPVAMPIGPGDHVVFPRSAGVWVEVEDERLLVCRVREILGVIEQGPAPDER